MNEQEYKTIMGLNSIDLGSVHALRKEVVRLAKEGCNIRTKARQLAIYR